MPPERRGDNLFSAQLSSAQWLPLLHNRRTDLGHLGIQGNELALISGNIIFKENRLDGTFMEASIAINAFIWVNVEHLFAIPKTVARANDDAVRVFAAKAILGDDVGHFVLLGECDPNPPMQIRANERP